MSGGKTDLTERVAGFVTDFELRDQERCYEPSKHEKRLIEAALHGFLAEVEDDISVSKGRFEEGLKYSEQDRAGIAERAIDEFRFRKEGFEVRTHPELRLENFPEAWHEKPFARIYYDGEGPDMDAGLSGWEGFCLSEGQAGTVLADILAAQSREKQARAAIETAIENGWLRHSGTCVFRFSAVDDVALKRACSCGLQAFLDGLDNV